MRLRCFILLVLVSMGFELPAEDSTTALQKRFAELLATYPHDLKVGIWIGSAKGNTFFETDSDRSRPTASAIKTAFLIELFAKHANRLDEVPGGLEDILRDDHPAIAHFAMEQRDEIRSGLSQTTVRRLGRIMMGSEKASNLVYNAAANVTTALIGGPEALTRSIHARSPEFREVVVRRYMLAPRNLQGDNTATPRSLAAVYREASKESIAGLSKEISRDIRDAILQSNQRYGIDGQHVFKDGSLDSLPLTRVQSGWVTTGRASDPLIYVVMLEQPKPGELSQVEAGMALGRIANDCTKLVLSAVLDQEKTLKGRKDR